MSLSEILKELRLEANLTQKELALKLNIGQSTIVGYEKGEREATLTNLSRYADFFGVSLDFLAGRENDYGAKVAAPMPSLAAPMSAPFSADERKLIEVYNSLSSDMKQTLWSLLSTWSPSITTRQKN